MTNSSSSPAQIQSIEHFISHYSVKFLHSLPSPPIHPTPHPSPPSPSASRQAASSAMESGDDALCSPDAPPHPKLLLFSRCVCAHPHPHRLRPGARGGNGWEESCFFFFSLFDFVFLSPFQPVPFPPPKKKKRKRQTQIKYLSGTVLLAQAASVCFVLPPSLPGMPPVWTLGPQFHDLFTPSTLSQPLSLLSLIFSTFIASLHHDHYQLGRAGPLLSCLVPRFPCMWIPPRECSGPGSFSSSFTAFSPNPLPVWFPSVWELSFSPGIRAGGWDCKPSPVGGGEFGGPKVWGPWKWDWLWAWSGS